MLPSTALACASSRIGSIPASRSRAARKLRRTRLFEVVRVRMLAFGLFRSYSVPCGAQLDPFSGPPIWSPCAATPVPRPRLGAMNVQPPPTDHRESSLVDLVTPLEPQAPRLAPEPDALARLVELVEADLHACNRTIVARMDSPVALIPRLAAHIVAAG